MRYYHEKVKALGWFTDDMKEIWPEDSEARAETARERFGFALTNSMDTTFIHYKNRLLESETLSHLSEEQKQFILEEYDSLLDFAVYHFGMLFDRFEHGILEIRHGKQNEDEEMIDPVVIQPNGIFEMFQDAVRWKEEYGRGKTIGRNNT